jgi:hypothetical protein
MSLGIALFITFYAIGEYFGLHKAFSFLIASVGSISIFVPNFYVIHFGSDLKMIEKALISNRAVPLYNFILASANRDDKEVAFSIEALLNRYKSSSKQALFRTLHAAYKEEILTVKEEIKLITPEKSQYFYQALVSIEEGNIMEAEKYKNLVDKPITKNILKIEMMLKVGQLAEAYQLSLQALEQAKGIQKYTIYKSIERYFPMFIDQHKQVI